MANDVSGLEALRGKILLHAGNNETAANPLVAAAADGVIFHGRAGVRHGAAWASSANRRLVLHDPDRYSNQSREAENPSLFGPFDDELAAQRRLSVDAFLSPSVLPARGDHRALESVFDQGAQFLEAARRDAPDTPGFIVVCASPWWLTGDGRDRLEQAVAASDNPIALVLAESGDPLQQRESIDAVLSLVEQASALLSIRCDVSTVGLIANGALAGAVGASSTYRHLFLPRRGGGGGKGRVQHLFVYRLMAWHQAEELVLVAHVDDLFLCPCSVCDGRDVRRLVGPGFEMDALLHQVAAIQLLSDAVLDTDDPADAWTARCTAARDAYVRIQRDASVKLTEPAFLGAWAPRYSPA